MEENIQNKESITYKCPSCGGTMEFDAKSGKLKCSYCSVEMSIEELASKTTKEENFTPKPEVTHEESEFLHYHCSSCGAEILTEKDTTATICSFCGSPTLMKDRLMGATKPDKVIPFKIERKEMEASFRKWTKKGRLTPTDFTSRNTINKITGLYAPFWLFDYHTHTELDAHCTRVRMERKGDTEYTYTSHFEVSRGVEVDYNQIPADASERLDDEMMDKLEPFHYGELKDFSMQYLAGFQSEKYNFTGDDLQNRVRKRVTSYADDAARETINGYDTVSVVRNQVDIVEKDSSYVLMPVWLLNYQYRGKKYTFALNGQTGKIVGNLPISPYKIAKWYGITFGIVTVLSALIGGLL